MGVSHRYVCPTKYTCTYTMSSAESSQAQLSASGSKTKKVASSKKTKVMSTKNGHPSYRTMITNALHVTKDRKGLSRPAIMKYMVGASIVPNTGLLNKMLKKMSDEGKVVPEAEVGKSGSGCFKLSIEEKIRLLKIEKTALKKDLKAKGSENVKKVSKKSGHVAKKSSEISKRSAKGGKGTKAVKSKLKSSSSKAMTSKVSGSAKKKALGAKPKKSV